MNSISPPLRRLLLIGLAVLLVALCVVALAWLGLMALPWWAWGRF